MSSTADAIRDREEAKRPRVKVTVNVKAKTVQKDVVIAEKYEKAEDARTADWG